MPANGGPYLTCLFRGRSVVTCGYLTVLVGPAAGPVFGGADKSKNSPNQNAWETLGKTSYM